MYIFSLIGSGLTRRRLVPPGFVVSLGCGGGAGSGWGGCVGLLSVLLSVFCAFGSVGSPPLAPLWGWPSRACGGGRAFGPFGAFFFFFFRRGSGGSLPRAPLSGAALLGLRVGFVPSASWCCVCLAFGRSSPRSARGWLCSWPLGVLLSPFLSFRLGCGLSPSLSPRPWEVCARSGARALGVFSARVGRFFGLLGLVLLSCAVGLSSAFFFCCFLCLSFCLAVCFVVSASACGAGRWSLLFSYMLNTFLGAETLSKK